MAGYYDYKELKEKAINGTQEDINNLGEWFEAYGSRYWNGEYYDADDDLRLFPIYENEYDDGDELIQANVIGYEFR